MSFPRIILSKPHVDHRGSFSEVFHARRLREIGIACTFVQDNLSTSTRAGTLRGLHFQLPPVAQAKLVTVLRGRILDVVVDVRRGSPTYGKHVSTELSSQSSRQLYVPVGFAHGYLTLEDEVSVMYKVSDYYTPECRGGIRWNDPDIAFPWPFEHIITSEKDARLPFLKDFDSPFGYTGDPLVPLIVPDPGYKDHA